MERAFRHKVIRTPPVCGWLATVAAALALQGCGASLAPPTTGSINPRPTGPAAARQAECSAEAATGKATTVESMLASARTSSTDAGKANPAAASSQDCATARMRAQLAAATGGAGEAAAESGVSKDANELLIEFDGDSARLAAKEKSAISSLLAINRKAGRKIVRIQAGRGGGGNIFEQAVLAQQRARTVKDLLPPDVKVTVEFDPAQAEDTVRIEFVKS